MRETTISIENDGEQVIMKIGEQTNYMNKDLAERVANSIHDKLWEMEQ